MIKYPSTTYYKDLMGRAPIPPAVSILLPVHSVFSATAGLRHRLKVVMEDVRHQLTRDYTPEAVVTIMEKLEKLRAVLNENAIHKGVAIFASIHKAKLYYLDLQVDERIVIGESFAIRDLVADSKQLRQYLILVMTAQHYRFCLAGPHQLEQIHTGSPAGIYAYINEKPERVANFSDPGERREIVMDKFVHRIDQELTHVLAQHPLPVFVLGPEKLCGHFRANTRHIPQIAAYIHGSYADAGAQELLALVQPSLELRLQHNRQLLVRQVEAAADAGTLTPGIINAWTAGWHNNGRLLVVEKSFRFCARHGDSPDCIFREDNPEENPFCMEDAVEELIGEIISRGGDVEFVDDGALKEYGRLALIRYY